MATFNVLMNQGAKGVSYQDLCDTWELTKATSLAILQGRHECFPIFVGIIWNPEILLETMKVVNVTLQYFKGTSAIFAKDMQEFDVALVLKYSTKRHL